MERKGRRQRVIYLGLLTVVVARDLEQDLVPGKSRRDEAIVDVIERTKMMSLDTMDVDVEDEVARWRVDMGKWCKRVERRDGGWSRDRGRLRQDEAGQDLRAWGRRSDIETGLFRMWSHDALNVTWFVIDNVFDCHAFNFGNAVIGFGVMEKTRTTGNTHLDMAKVLGYTNITS